MTEFDTHERTKTLKRKRANNIVLNYILPLAAITGAAFGYSHCVRTDYNHGETPKTVQARENDNPSEEVSSFIRAREEYRKKLYTTLSFSFTGIVLAAGLHLGVGLGRDGNIQDEIRSLQNSI